MTTRAIITLLATTLAAAPALAEPCAVPQGGPRLAPTLEGPIAAIVDGDTIDIRAGGKVRRVRLYGIDAPEHQNTAGLLARAALERLAEGKRAACAILAEDRYKRSVAVCRVADGPDLSLAQIATGNAATYRRYLTDARLRPAYIEAETQARADRCGIWK